MDSKDISLTNRLQKNIDENLKIIDNLFYLMKNLDKINAPPLSSSNEIKEISSSLLENIKKLIVITQEQINITADLVKNNGKL
ncbi:MAG: hypothetical protein WCT51_03185 [Candidatus Shapirobacteria bacterium]|jgi:hypothetical protein